jgi:NitT/TauT family transport system substrate-binding protein
MKKHLFASILALLLCAVLLAGCGSSAAPAAPAQEEQPAPSAEAASEEQAAPGTEAAPEAVPDTEEPVRVYTLNGTTGFGMAGLIAEAAEGNAALNYTFSVESDPSVVAAALVSGDCDIAALPTNAAAALYNKTGGKVQVLALNTRGVLYLLTDGTVQAESLEDLAGQTVYAPAQNPSFILAALCRAKNVDMIIDNSYAQPAELNAAAASGQVSLAVLPEPMVTVACAQNPALQAAIDLSAEWDEVMEPGSLVQGCVVVRREFAETHGAELALFLEEYGRSVALLEEDAQTAAQKIEQAGIFSNAAVAAKAIPRCNICFVTGEEMQRQLSAFLQTMFETAPQSIGGSVPGEDFYYIGK